MAGGLKTIAEALPTIEREPDFLALLDRFQLNLGDEVKKIAALNERAEDLFEALAELIIETQPGKHLSNVVPGLMLQTDAIPVGDLSTRPANALRRRRVAIFPQLGRLSAAGLMSQHGLGRKSVKEILSLALRKAVIGNTNSKMQFMRRYRRVRGL
jgi:hypothetical protein